MKQRWISALAVAACLSAAMPQASAQTDNRGILTTVDGQKVRLLGFVATGPQPDVERLSAAAAATPFFSKELVPPANPYFQVMVIFRPGSSDQAALAFLARAKSSEFSSLYIAELTVPVRQ